MTIYYIAQHVILGLGLALFAVTLPKWFRVALLPRALIAASLVPQLIGLVVMILAILGVHDTQYYIHAPVVVGLGLTLYSINRVSSRKCFNRLRLRITPSGFVILGIGVAFALRLGLVLYSNAESLNVRPHDFNVYLSAAKAFAASPGWENIPTFYGDVGDVIVVHPHSFIYEAYLSHSLMFGVGEEVYPPLHFHARLAQQLTVVYLLSAVAGAAIVMGGRWSVVAVLCLVVSIPLFSYISASLSRDAFRMAPVLGYVILLATLSVNFRSSLFRRGVLAGLLLALVVMSHTLGVLLGAVMGGVVMIYALLRMRPGYRSVLAYSIPLVLLGSLAVYRYVQYYMDTGWFMGYGLQYSIYQGTWIESVKLGVFADNNKSWYSVLGLLFNRYGISIQAFSFIVSILVIFFSSGRGIAAYRAVMIAFWVPLLLGVSGLLDYSGINLKDALIANFRYALSFFLLSAPLLGVGVARLGYEISTKLELTNMWRQIGAIVFSCAIAWQAHEALKSSSWRSRVTSPGEISHIQYIRHALDCLGKDENWLVGGDRWNPYFNAHPPLFAFSLPARPLLIANDVREIETVIRSMKIKFAVFIEKPKRWHGTPLYQYLENNWKRIFLTGGYRKREFWMAPSKASCIGEPN